jgi:hypothetical protein
MLVRLICAWVLLGASGAWACKEPISPGSAQGLYDRFKALSTPECKLDAVESQPERMLVRWRKGDALITFTVEPGACASEGAVARGPWAVTLPPATREACPEIMTAAEQAVAGAPVIASEVTHGPSANRWIWIASAGAVALAVVSVLVIVVRRRRRAAAQR